MGSRAIFNKEVVMRLIKTKYFGPTNTKGSRIKAMDDNGNSITVAYKHDLNIDDNHIYAVFMLLYKLRIDAVIVNSATFNNDYFHFIKR